MAEPVDLRSGVELKAVEAHAGPNARSAEEWFESAELAGATQLLAIFTLSMAIGLSTQCPTESIRECLLLVTTVTPCNDSGCPLADDNDVFNISLFATDAVVQLLLVDMDVAVHNKPTMKHARIQQIHSIQHYNSDFNNNNNKWSM